MKHIKKSLKNKRKIRKITKLKVRKSRRRVRKRIISKKRKNLRRYIRSNKRGGSGNITSNFCSEKKRLAIANYNNLLVLTQNFKSNLKGLKFVDTDSEISEINLGEFTKLADSINKNIVTQISNNSKLSFQEFYFNLANGLGNILREIFSVNDESINNLMTWQYFTSDVIPKLGSDMSHCKYHIFRKNVVDYLILFIIINLFNYKNIEIYDGANNLIFDNYKTKGEGVNVDLKITYEMVGSVDVSSDYDVTIYSNPPAPKIAAVNSLFNYCFKLVTDKSSGEIFDTNLYTHPVYMFLKEGDELYNKYKNSLISLGNGKYFINPTIDKPILDNEKAFANILHLPHYLKSGFTQNSQQFFGDSSDSSAKDRTNIAKELGSMTLNSPLANYDKICYDNSEFENEDISIVEGIGADDSLILTKKALDEHNMKFRNNNIYDRRNSIATSRASISSEASTASLQDSSCDKISEKNDTINPHNNRLAFERIAIEFINDKNCANHKSDKTPLQNLIDSYVGPMRAALYYADETYHTFSAYFHVIHCIATINNSLEGIRQLLSSNDNIESFKDICRISAIENFSFMFHYTDNSNFNKKTAKYLARISHALSLINELNKDNLNKEELINELNSRNIGSHNDIVNKYKRKKERTKITNSLIDIDGIYLKDTGKEKLQEVYKQINGLGDSIINLDELFVIKPNV